MKPLVLAFLALAASGAAAKGQDAAISGQFRSIDSGVYTAPGWTCLMVQGDEPIAGDVGPVLTIACHGSQGLRSAKVWGGCPAAGTGQPWGLSPLGSYAPDTQFELISIPIGGVLQTRIDGEAVTLARVSPIAPAWPNRCGFSTVSARDEVGE